MRLRPLRAAGLAACLLAAAAAPAGAKDFGPGDLRLCNAQRCVALANRDVLRSLARFYYSGPVPAEVRAPRLGSPYFQLRFRNGYVTGVAATANLDRFRSGGVHLGRFGSDEWYRIPARAAAGLRRAASDLRPLRATESTIGPTRHG